MTDKQIDKQIFQAFLDDFNKLQRHHGVAVELMRRGSDSPGLCLAMVQSDNQVAWVMESTFSFGNWVEIF